jgi:putative DNA primase/helicase
LLPGDYGTIPDNPTKGEAEQAAAMLLDVVSEFPCQDIDRAAWLAYVLTLMVRMAIDGNVPMWAFNANQWGSGKGLMIDLGNRIAFGQPSAVRAYDPDPSETRKGITACLMQGLASVCFDNVRDKVANSTLEAALTAQVWSDRLLGKNSETISRPQNLVFSISGNNLRFGGDMGRRLLMVSLFSTVDRPEERKFRQADVVAYVMENRFKLIAAALTILRYRWVAGTMENGRLLPELTPIGSFEAWSRIVRDAVYIATGIDPWLTNQRVRKSDVDEAALEAIHQAFSRYPNGVLASEIIHTESVYTELILETFGIDRGSKGAAVSLGKRLDRFINRIHKGQFLVKNRNDKGFMEYRLETVENLPDGG